ncbi:MAG: carboxypeptidase-like regulatory domain-containing protein, partial [Verrucomicrobiota bacterium]
MKRTSLPPPSRAFLPAVFRLVLLTFLAGGAAHAQATGVISGSVVSTATRNGLQGATVSVPAQGRTEFTDSAGLFLLQGVSPGAVEVVVSYSAFEERRVTVTVRGGETARVEVEMKPAQAIVMDRFTVATVREGQALAITEQRNALNVKSVTALDEWGVLPTQNVGELVSRLPGITFTTDEDNLI